MIVQFIEMFAPEPEEAMQPVRKRVSQSINRRCFHDAILSLRKQFQRSSPNGQSQPLIA